MTYTDDKGQEWITKEVYIEHIKSKNTPKKPRIRKKSYNPKYYTTPNINPRIKKICERCKIRQAVTTTWNYKVVCHACHLSILDEYDTHVQN